MPWDTAKVGGIIKQCKDIMITFEQVVENLRKFCWSDRMYSVGINFCVFLLLHVRWSCNVGIQFYREPPTGLRKEYVYTNARYMIVS